MSKITGSIGLKFERVVQEIFPDLRAPAKNKMRGVNLFPDFYHPQYGFWIETKTGNIKWGTRIKRGQIESYAEFASIIYAMGFHNFDRAYKRLTHKTENGRQNFLDEHMQIQEIHFITQEVMEKLWEKEKRFNKKGTTEYCTLKGSILRNVYENRSFKRNGKKCTVESFYGFNPEDFLIIPSNGNLESISFGAVLNPERDEAFIKYLKTAKLADF